MQTSPFYGKSEAGSLGESKIKKTPSPNRHKIPHFRLNTIFLSIFHTVTCILIYFLVALTNFKKSLKQLLRIKPINFQVYIMANTPQLKTLFQNIYYYHFLFTVFHCSVKFQKNWWKVNSEKKCTSFTMQIVEKMAHFGRVGVFPKARFAIFFEHNDLTVL